MLRTEQNNHYVQQFGGFRINLCCQYLGRQHSLGTAYIPQPRRVAKDEQDIQSCDIFSQQQWDYVQFELWEGQREGENFIRDTNIVG